MKIMRWTVRFLFLAGFTSLAVIADNPARLHGLLPACSPFLALLTLAAGGASLILLPAGLLAAIAILQRRFICRWVCPAGTCFEMIGSRFPSRRWISRVPRLGIWFLFLAVGAAIIGFPLFLVLDPFAIFASAFGWLRSELTAWEVAGACVFPLMLILAAVVPWLWCGRLCPLGALQDILFLPIQLYQRRKEPGRASVNDKVSPTNELVDTGRRIFLGLGAGAAYRLLLNPAKANADAAVIRPPLSCDEARFTRLCARCGACARACPEQIIIQDGMESGFAGLLAPTLDFSRAGCAPECTRCGEACPTGAIPRFTERDKSEYPLGVAVVKRELCVLTHGRECGVCLNACPHSAIDIAWDPIEMESVLKIDDTLCTGCGICQYLCPERPVAIVVQRQRTSVFVPQAELRRDKKSMGHGQG